MSHSEEKPIKCELCGKGFKTIDQVKIHMIVHKLDTPEKCPFCGKGFKTPRHLKLHEQRCRLNPANKNFTTVDDNR